MTKDRERKKRKRRERARAAAQAAQVPSHSNRACIVCGGVPTVADTELCGPCCFGEAETVGGNW